MTIADRVREYLRSRDGCATVYEVAAATGLSRKKANSVLSTLHRDSYLRRHPAADDTRCKYAYSINRHRVSRDLHRRIRAAQPRPRQRQSATKTLQVCEECRVRIFTHAYRARHLREKSAITYVRFTPYEPLVHKRPKAKHQGAEFIS